MIYNGDCLDVMRTMEANSVDCVVTDPPYGLSFMGKDWDHGIPGIPFWEAALRVMKPGAFLLSFGGTRTFHRLTCAIEDSGFEIRDCMMWLYGSGFPKSHDVSKAIDKAAGAEREVLGIRKGTGNKSMRGDSNGKNLGPTISVTAPSTDAAKQWAGWGTALKPAWEPIIVARKPIEGTVAQNVLKWGCGAMNIDGGRIGTTDTLSFGSRELGDGIKYGKCKPSTPGIQNPQGRWPANVILDEEAGAMLDGQSGDMPSAARKRSGQYGGGVFGGGLKSAGTEYPDSGGASRFFYCAKASKRERNAGLEGMPEVPNMRVNAPRENEAAKLSNIMANNHPTVKPISLLQYIIKLVCPPGGIVLDPFLGSGSTAVAAQGLGFNFFGIEKEESYCEIARARLGLVAA